MVLLFDLTNLIDRLEKPTKFNYTNISSSHGMIDLPILQRACWTVIVNGTPLINPLKRMQIWILNQLQITILPVCTKSLLLISKHNLYLPFFRIKTMQTSQALTPKQR